MTGCVGTLQGDLLRSRCSVEDWRVWCDRARADAPWSATRAHVDRVVQAIRSIEDFAMGPRGYIGVSWGKDSCAVLLLSLRLKLDWPVVYVRLDPVANPDCERVRDAWLTRHPSLSSRYHEISIVCRPKPSTGRFDTNAAYAEGFSEASSRFGERRISGVRAEESGSRTLTMRRNGRGGADSLTSRPIGWWRSEDVFALLRDEPMHPAYPCTMDGAIDRHRVRVNNLWGLYGEGHGRAEWERRYYPNEIGAMTKSARARSLGIEECTVYKP